MAKAETKKTAVKEKSVPNKKVTKKTAVKEKVVSNKKETKTAVKEQRVPNKKEIKSMILALKLEANILEKDMAAISNALYAKGIFTDKNMLSYKAIVRGIDKFKTILQEKGF